MSSTVMYIVILFWPLFYFFSHQATQLCHADPPWSQLFYLSTPIIYAMKYHLQSFNRYSGHDSKLQYCTASTFRPHPYHLELGSYGFVYLTMVHNFLLILLYLKKNLPEKIKVYEHFDKTSERSPPVTVPAKYWTRFWLQTISHCKCHKSIS